MYCTYIFFFLETFNNELSSLEESSLPEKNSPCGQLNYTATPEKNHFADFSHSSQNMLLDGSPTCSPFDNSLKSDDDTIPNEFADEGSEDDYQSINSTYSSDCEDNESINTESCSSNYSDDETDVENLIKHDNDDLVLPEKECQALSLVSCFLRNKFSASTSRDVIETFKSTFPHCEELHNLDLQNIMSTFEDISLKVFHYCRLCKQVFPSDKDAFHCATPNCDGLRYKGGLSSQEKKSRQPVGCFVFTDIKKQLVDLLQTPGM